MSSSHRNSRNESQTPTGSCPTCGKPRLTRVTEAVTLSVGHRKYRLADVTHELCSRCGERVFGIEASQRFDALLRSARRRRAA